MAPRRARSDWSTGRWIAAILAVAVNIAFIAFLVFSVTWQSRKLEPVSVELYAPPAPAVEKLEPPKRPPEPPKPQPEPQSEPPKAELLPPTKAEIALKAK